MGVCVCALVNIPCYAIFNAVMRLLSLAIRRMQACLNDYHRTFNITSIHGYYQYSYSL